MRERERERERETAGRIRRVIEGGDGNFKVV